MDTVYNSSCLVENLVELDPGSGSQQTFITCLLCIKHQKYCRKQIPAQREKQRKKSLDNGVLLGESSLQTEVQARGKVRGS